MTTIIELLKDKDDKKAYALTKEMLIKCSESDEYYSLFDDFFVLIDSKGSYVRTRGFLLCAAQARYDTQGKLQKALPIMLQLLHDEKPTVVRQCLYALHEVALFRPELCEMIQEEIETMDVSKYRDSMRPLIVKDMKELMKMIEV